MKRFILIFLLITGCSSDKNLITYHEPEPEIKAEKIVKEPEVSTGWADNDTYTVRVTAADTDRAVDSAKHRILQDIVRVRVLNDSRFTDISMISDEFDKPLKEGRIISERETADGVEIYFQIRDKGLRNKFERK